MSEERLDRIEAGLDQTRKIVDSNARAILAELASIVFDTTARQQDHENRINRIEQE